MRCTGRAKMTRHALTENFDNRDVALAKGELVIILENERSGERGFGAGDRYQGGLERAGGYHHVMVKTRHGRKVRIPRHMLSKDMVVFNCQLCLNPALPTYREYVDHMIDKHLRVQLLKGLDMTKKQPTCPFPSCHGMTWPIVDNLLFHYASHHNVLEKVVMYESEVAAEELRDSICGKERTIEDLVKEIGDLKKTEAEVDGKEEGGGEVHGGNIQGAKEMRVIMGQMKEELDMLRHKIGSKNSTIKSLKDDLIEAKRSFKSCEKRYEDVVKFNLSIQNELKIVKNDVKMAPGVVGVQDVQSDSSLKTSAPVDGEISELKLKIVQLQAELEGKDSEENSVSSSGESSSSMSKDAHGNQTNESNNTVGNLSTQDEIDDLRGKVERLTDQTEAWQKQNDSLQLEIENMHMQNENLKNIIEIGKSTVETAKKISQDLAEENKIIKQRGKQNLADMQKVETDFNKFKLEKNHLASKYDELQGTLRDQSTNVSKLHEEIDSKSIEVQHLHTQLASNATVKDDAKVIDKNHKLLGEMKLMTSVKEDLKSKLIKCRENCRNVEDSKRCLDRDYKALIVENRNAANEIKTLKNHLSSNRAIVVEKAVAKDEVVNLRTEVAAKNVEVEKSNLKLKKISNELNCVLVELKQAKESKTFVENEAKSLKNKLRKISNPVELSKPNEGSESIETTLKLKLKEDELSVIRADYNVLKEAKEELQERMDFYVSQCSEFEKNDSQLQEEIILLQTSIKKSTMVNAVKTDSLENTVQGLENDCVFYKDQEEVMIDENEKLKNEVDSLKAQVERGYVNEDLLGKYNLKCDMVEELLKKHEKIAAQLRRKDWEIDNYQKKLDSAFEAEYLAFPREASALDMPVDTGSPVSVDVRSPECIALDLSTKEKPSVNELNNNEVKEEDSAATVAGPSGVVVTSTKRKFSECSSASQSLDDSNPISLHENLDASFDSTSTCPSEAAMLSTSHVSGQVFGGRKRSKSLGGPTPRKIPYVRLEDD